MTVEAEYALLQSGISKLEVEVTQQQQEQLLQYVQLLEKWNKAYNLTAVRDRQEMIRRHLLDSLSVLPYIDQSPLLDVGTGPGLPGLVLAVCRPGQQMVLLDSNGKKVRFVRQAALELGLDNVEVVQSRVEAYRRCFPQITCRAFSSLAQTLELLRPLLAPEGKVLAMKGAIIEQEMNDLLKQIPGQWQVQNHRLHVPGINEERYLTVCRIHQDMATAGTMEAP